MHFSFTSSSTLVRSNERMREKERDKARIKREREKMGDRVI